MKRRLAMLSVRIGSVRALGFLALGAYYGFTRPDHADPSSERIYRVSRAFNPTYLTERELRYLCIFGGGAVPFLIVAAALGWPFPNYDYQKARATYARDEGGDDSP